MSNAFLQDDRVEHSFDRNWQPRKLRRTDPADPWLREGAVPPHAIEDMEGLVRREGERIAGSQGSQVFEILGIVVGPRDGKTWSAARARQVLGAVPGGVGPPVCVRGSSAGREPLQELADLVGGEKIVLEAARRSGLVPVYEFPGSGSVLRRRLPSPGGWCGRPHDFLGGRHDRVAGRGGLRDRSRPGSVASPNRDAHQRPDWTGGYGPRTHCLERPRARRGSRAGISGRPARTTHGVASALRRRR